MITGSFPVTTSLSMDVEAQRHSIAGADKTISPGAYKQQQYSVDGPHQENPPAPEDDAYVYTCDTPGNCLETTCFLTVLSMVVGALVAAGPVGLLVLCR